MGLNHRQIAFVASMRRLGVDFDRSLTIGRQTMWADEALLAEAFDEAGVPLVPAEAARIVADGDGYCESLLRHLGASHVDSLDASDYESSSIVHDLNRPVQPALRGRYSLVLDAGTLEHVFDVPEALRTCLGAVAPGGHFITIAPSNNYHGHGFYQFSPELYHRVLSEENGFRVRAMLFRAERRGARWYTVTDPADIGGRVTLSGAFPSLLYVCAQRVSSADPLDAPPQQSDYSAVWSADDGTRIDGTTRRLPNVPVPVLQAVEWTRLLLGRPSRSGLHPVVLAQLAG